MIRIGSLLVKISCPKLVEKIFFATLSLFFRIQEYSENRGPVHADLGPTHTTPRKRHRYFTFLFLVLEFSYLNLLKGSLEKKFLFFGFLSYYPSVEPRHKANKIRIHLVAS